MLRVPTAITLVLATVVWSFRPDAAIAAQSPVGVSPGSPAGVVISDPCPTFSWGAERGADSYELVVYRVDEQDEDATPVLALSETIVGSASSWTPSLDRCLKRGGQYAWSVRALQRTEASDWSQPNLFDLVSRPSEAEFQAALQVVRSYLDANCAFCHRPDAPDSAGLDLRGSVPLEDTGMIDGVPRVNALGIPNARVVAPGDPARSILARRMRLRGSPLQMPPLGTHVADRRAIRTIERWIRRLGR